MVFAPEEVGKRIAAERTKRGWTHEEFREAVRTGIPGKEKTNLRTVQRWQTGRDPATGKSWLPRLATLMQLADLLDVPRSYFIEDALPEPGPDWMPPLRKQLEDEVARFRRLNDEIAAELKPAQPNRKRRGS